MKEITYCGLQVKEHPTLGVWVREDGAVLMRVGGPYSKTQEWTRGSYTKQGYLRVSIGGKEHRVHRLVAECFIPKVPGKDTVDHIDRIRDNNRVSNLRWADLYDQRMNSSSVIFKGNPAEVKRKWNELHADKIREYKRKYRQTHSKEIQERNREYRLRKKALISG